MMEIKKTFSIYIFIILVHQLCSFSLFESVASATPVEGGVESLGVSAVTEPADPVESVALSEGEGSAPPPVSLSPELSCPAPPGSVYPRDFSWSATLYTSQGEICCDLFHWDHPKTVANFIALSQDGILSWIDSEGRSTKRVFYHQRPFHRREPKAFVVCGDPKENQGVSPGFVIPDERCTSHKPVAGSLGMVQTYPGTAATQFFITSRDIPLFENLYTIFGQCHELERIEELTKTESTLYSISVHKGQSCKQP